MPKSRQIMATWVIAALNFWESFFYDRRLTFFQSKKEEDANENLLRCVDIFDNLPSFMKDYNPVKDKYCELSFGTTKSRIKGIPNDPDPVRQFTPSSLFVDEAAYVSEFADTFKAAKPALDGGGRFTAISSAKPCEFKHYVFDENM